MDSRVQELLKQDEKLFQRSALLNLWQEIAENFYPIRADFTTKITPGDDMTEHLSSSYPILAHRDMANTFSSMLRRRGTQWFLIRTGQDDVDHGPAREWLEWAGGLQFRAMYDRPAQFVRATKEGDHDFAAFGQTVIYVDTNRAGDTLLYRNRHLRDTAWVENAEGVIDTVHCRSKPTARDMVFDFGDKVHSSVRAELERGKDSFRKFEMRHIMLPTERAGDVPKGEKDFPFRSYFIDVENEHVIEEAPSRLLKYVIPRWQTMSGTPYAFSPAAIAALPDARMIQAMMYSLRDAVGKAVQPPMIAQANMIKSDLELWEGGTTWVDAEYDERLGEALRPIPLDLRGIPAGVEASRDVREMIAEAFYLNKLALPPAQGDMTAFETAKRIQEYIRQALPLFEPVEQEYNGQLCDMTFDTLMLGNAFGPVEDMPPELSGENIEFKFVSPLQEDEARKDAQVYLETKALLGEAAALDPTLVDMLDGREALRDALRGAGAPAKWLHEDDEMDEMARKRAQQQQAVAVMDDLERGGQVAEQLGNAASALNDAAA